MMSSFFTDASDYAAVGSLQTVIPAGATAGVSSRVCVTVSLVDDDLLEDDGEIFSALLQSENAKLGVAENTTVVSISDNDGNSYFYSVCTSSLIFLSMQLVIFKFLWLIGMEH